VYARGFPFNKRHRDVAASRARGQERFGLRAAGDRQVVQGQADLPGPGAPDRLFAVRPVRPRLLRGCASSVTPGSHVPSKRPGAPKARRGPGGR
jgi:hypothetical protein